MSVSAVLGIAFLTIISMTMRLLFDSIMLLGRCVVLSIQVLGLFDEYLETIGFYKYLPAFPANLVVVDKWRRE